MFIETEIPASFFVDSHCSLCLLRSPWTRIASKRNKLRSDKACKAFVVGVFRTAKSSLDCDCNAKYSL